MTLTSLLLSEAITKKKSDQINQGDVLGEPGTGYENPNDKGPFECGNCNFFKNNSCGQSTMMKKSKQPRLPNGRVKVDTHGCCEYVDRIG